ncbi:DUF3515 domain-containing protein [Nocardia sp. NPDC050406]|uniref:DUF3515 domain-containing protein n=1 Tax=Nocardia sp. NPDC050406 TaxID=3364318 RepID=UPI00378892D4
MSNDTHGSETEPTSAAEQSAESGNPETAATSSAAGSGSDAAGDSKPSLAKGDTDSQTADAARATAEGSAAPDTAGATKPSLAKGDSEADTARSRVEGGSEAKAAESAGEPEAAEPSSGRSPALIATAVALPIALLVGVLVMAVIARQNVTRDPLALGSVPAPGATGPACTALLPQLPNTLGDYTDAELAQPAPPATKAWQLPEGGEAIVLRCGLDRPLEFNRASPLQVVNGVNWFAVRDETSGVDSGTWFAVDRGTYVAVTMPDSAGPTPLQDISEAIKKAMPEQPLDPGPLPN